MSDTMTREELFGLVGQDLGTSDWFQLGQDRINQFADVTEDRQFIHIDPVRAADSPFGGTIAHGMLTLSMIVHLCDNFAPSVEGVHSTQSSSTSPSSRPVCSSLPLLIRLPARRCIAFFTCFSLSTNNS